MQIVIDIPKRTYEQLKFLREQGFDGFDTIIDIAVANGIPLPKGHGRLMILSEDKVKENQINLDFSCQKWISAVGLSNATLTIIGADTGSEE